MSGIRTQVRDLDGGRSAKDRLYGIAADSSAANKTPAQDFGSQLPTRPALARLVSTPALDASVFIISGQPANTLPGTILHLVPSGFFFICCSNNFSLGPRLLSF